VTQLGGGHGSSYPQAVDTRQTFQNVPTPAPDSSSRLDAELANDTLAAIVQMQVALGTNPQGVYGSVAARLQQFIPGGGTSPLFFSFASQTTFVIRGTEHRLGTATPLLQVYDDSTPAAALQPDQVTVDQLNYDVTLTFTTPQTGMVALAAPAPLYTTAFTNQASVSIPGTTHQLGTGSLLVSVYTSSGFTYFLTPAAVTINQSNFNVVVAFGVAQSGSILLSAAGPRFVQSFTSQTTVTIPGATHGLGSAALLYQVYDASTPANLIEPGSFTVDLANYTVTMTFLTPQSGFIVLVRASQITGNDFQIRDGGVTDATATRVYSESGKLKLQMGNGNAVDIEDKVGTVRASFTNDGRLGLGTAAPTFQLQLTGDAAKPGGGTWQSVSDARLKQVLGAFEDGLEVLEQLRPILYRFIGLGGMPQDHPRARPRIGLVAQDVEPHAPYMVGKTSGRIHNGEPATEILTLDEQPLVYLLLNAVVALAARVAVLETRLPQEETL
jgi:hypothetical protein